ncbi:nascent polypeptide-associated complex subunit alpha, muscle-specific form isoform X2 [Thunnus albacares]|uniref:nascent polypeptide-associated complex subunit alpha, muscle-specific form isoform X2 n=1 Tax=Thunnus albacares TaxID=8236 RepID=UPI001CF65D8C|nr:nascent polypeptide-associated complex subunit alpha, muscle-specific form isoform X2 [Thunnus albacares]
MKPDGVTMETTEPTEAAAEAEPSVSQDNITEQAPSQPEQAANDAAPGAAPKTNGKPEAAEPKVKPQGVASKMQATLKTAGASGSNSRPGAASHRTTNNVQSSNSNSAKTSSARKTTTTTTTTAKAASASAAGAVPKKPARVAAVSTAAKNQTRVPDKKPVGPTRTTSVAAATATNGTKTAVNGAPKRRTAAETVNAARPKSLATTSRLTSSAAPKPSTSTTAKAESGAISKTRTAIGPSTSRPASSTSRPTTAATKPSAPAAARTAASRVTTAPSTGRTTAAQPPKTAAAKKDVSRLPPAAGAKRPATGTTSAAAKIPDPSKPTATAKLNSASKWSATTKAADPKMSQPKTQQPAKSTPARKPGVAPARFNANNKLPIGRTPPASPANKPGSSSSSTPQAKRGTKPTQAVPPFTATKKTGVSNTTTSAEAQSPARAAGRTAAAAAAAAAAGAAVAVAAAPAATVLAEVQAETPVALPQESSVAVHAPEEVPPQPSTQDIPPEVIPQETVQSHSAAPSPPQSPVQTALPETAPPQEQLESSAPLLITQEQVSVPVEPTLPPVASPPGLSEEPVYLLTDQTPSASKAFPAAAAAAIPQLVPPTNLNEEEYEEEREGSLPVSLSEMSGTTQPTEESRPGSAGPVGGSAWRAGGALLSELDSEDVSGSQLGASELSAPGVLEGAESMDDLGDGSLKGASAGSPDFEKVPDIPVNDFEEDDDEDDDDDNDRVCDMDVGSERIDEPQRPRDDNDVEDEEEDEDVEMASEGVTESGLESYGNADEDDFAEDERLDNLNRVAQPPPPPQLPSAPAAQWDQQNPFADHWAEPLQPLQPQQLLGHMAQPLQAAGAAAASPLVDLWQADSETPTQSPAQPWLELGTAPFVPENQQLLPHSSVKDGAQMYMDQPGPAPMQTLAPALLSAPAMSLSSTLSSETSSPEDLGDYNGEGKLQPQDTQAPALSPQLDLDDQDLGIHLERGDGEGEEDADAEAETLPADEVLGGPATAPTSNPSSSSVTEDEASDTEGEAQLDDSLESPAVTHITFDSQPASQRCLSTVEEGEEADMVEGVVCEDTTPPSATSLASYGFDTMTTASSSNAQSTGESCIKSPGIFSLEELPEEAKDPCLIPQPLSQPCLAEQQYIECGKQEAESAEHAGEEVPGSEEAPDPSAALSTLQQPEENPDDMQPPYYSAICEKTENSFAGFTALPHAHRRDHSAHPRTYCDIVKPIVAAAAPPRLTCADLPPRNVGQQALSPQLRRLEQHQRQLLELQQRREQQSRPLEEAEQERKRREEEEQRRKKQEAEEEIKRNKEEEERKTREQAEEAATKKKEEEEKQRRDLEMQLQQQQEELKQRQQIMQWQQELQQSNKGQTVLLSPSSGLCTIYEALENSDEEADGEEEGIKELKPTKEEEEEEPEQETPNEETDDNCERAASDVEEHRDSSPSNETPPPPPPHPDSPHTPSNVSQDGDSSSPPESPERPPPLDLDWGKKVDIVQQLINQTLLLNGDGCSSLLLLPGGAGGTLSPLESSLWPSLLPPLTPPSATVTSVSSFSPEATGSSPQGEWTVVELETHH